MKYVLILIVLIISLQVRSEIMLKELKGIDSIKIKKINRANHANFCKLSIILTKNHRPNKTLLKLSKALKTERFCATSKFDNNKDEDLIFNYYSSGEMPPCSFMLVLNYKKEHKRIFTFSSDSVQSCNIQKFSKLRYKKLFGNSNCEISNSNEPFTIYGEGIETTVFILDRKKMKLKIVKCYGGAD